MNKTNESECRRKKASKNAYAQKQGFRADTKGSLTVEALLILPAILLLLALYLRWALVLRAEIQDMADKRKAAPTMGLKGVVTGFPAGTDGEIEHQNETPPARRIRDADLLVDLGKSIKERLPVWFPVKDD